MKVMLEQTTNEQPYQTTYSRLCRVYRTSEGDRIDRHAVRSKFLPVPDELVLYFPSQDAERHDLVEHGLIGDVQHMLRLLVEVPYTNRAGDVVQRRCRADQMRKLRQIFKEVSDLPQKVQFYGQAP